MVIGTIISLLFSAFFSGMEIAFVSSNKMIAEMDRTEKNGISQNILHFFYTHSNTFISTMLVGNNIVLVVYGILIAALFDSTIFYGMSEGIKVPADTILSTIIVLFTGEFLPKTLFRINPNRMLTIFAIPTYIIYWILYPISQFATLCSHLLLHLAGVKTDKSDKNTTFSRVDLDHLVTSVVENAKNDDEINDEVKIFQNALDFTNTKIRDCMVPRTEITGIERKTTVNELLQSFVESGRSKIIVYNEDIDNIEGYIHSSELFRLPSKYIQTGTPVCELLEKKELSLITMPIVPEIITAPKLMKRFMEEKKTLGVVVDEFGGTAGIVALEDLVEEIFGEIEDEHDKDNIISKKIKEGDKNGVGAEYLFSGRMEIGNVNSEFGLNLPESEEYQTIGGLILHVYESFPKVNDMVKAGRYHFRIIKSTTSYIELVKLTIAY
ncbi:MAG: HlyC/CorC family transporter [Prevotella sp.]|nr:HlyC/CorC family transporter [Candidatus Equicola stercoris]